jgi:hypothetical protein
MLIPHRPDVPGQCLRHQSDWHLLRLPPSVTARQGFELAIVTGIRLFRGRGLETSGRRDGVPAVGDFEGFQLGSLQSVRREQQNKWVQEALLNPLR